MRIVFFGTPDFAATSLRQLVSNGYQVVGVVTAPDRPSGRGYRLQPSAVKEMAQKILPNVPILQPEKLRDPGFLSSLKELGGDLFVVVAFRMLPMEVWAMPPRGTFNLHASLLPKYRGAAPIQHAILNGEKKTGVTTFFLDEQIDTGRIILQEEVPISEDDDGGSLHDKLMEVGANLVCKTIDKIAEAKPDERLGTCQSTLVNDSDLPLPCAPKIFKEDRALSFREQDAEQILLRVRAMSPYPTAFATLNDGKKTEIKVYKAEVVPDVVGLKPGELLVTPARELIVQTKRLALRLLVLQPPSKRIMRAEDYLLGNEISGSFL